MGEWKKPVSKSYIVHDSIITTFWKGKTVGKENRPVVARGWGLGEGLTTKEHAKEFSGVLELFFILIVVDTHIYTYVKMHRAVYQNQMCILQHVHLK